MAGFCDPFLVVMKVQERANGIFSITAGSIRTLNFCKTIRQVHPLGAAIAIIYFDFIAVSP